MIMKKLARTLAAAVAAVLSVSAGVVSGTASADTLDRIKERGPIVVGVKSDFKPWGFLDPMGKPIGMEIDLAADVAQRLGVKLNLVPVQTANRIDFLRQGKIDL